MSISEEDKKIPDEFKKLAEHFGKNGFISKSKFFSSISKFLWFIFPVIENWSFIVFIKTFSDKRFKLLN